MIRTAAQFLQSIFDVVYGTGGSLQGQYDIVRVGNTYFLARMNAKTLQYDLRSVRKIDVKLTSLSEKEKRKFRETFP